MFFLPLRPMCSVPFLFHVCAFNWGGQSPRSQLGLALSFGVNQSQGQGDAKSGNMKYLNINMSQSLDCGSRLGSGIRVKVLVIDMDLYIQILITVRISCWPQQQLGIGLQYSVLRYCVLYLDSGTGGGVPVEYFKTLMHISVFFYPRQCISSNNGEMSAYFQAALN